LAVWANALGEATSAAYSCKTPVTRERLKFRAGLSRFLIAAMGLVVLPVFYPRTRAHMWVWASYLVVAGVAQEMIRRDVGGRTRTIAFGIVDAAVLTFTVHVLGSVSTPLLSIYFFACVANALVGDVRVTLVLAAANSLLYDAVVWAEWGGLLPFAPDVPRLAALGQPQLDQVVAATAFITAFMFSGTAIVGRLVVALEQNERQLTEANQRLEALSQHDPLTELYNRRYLFDRVSAELARVRRGHPLAVVMLDLDGFKKVNDSMGHMQGDALLRDIGASLVTTTRVTDIVGRYGGDEFLLVLPDTDSTQANIVAERVVAAMRATGDRTGAGRSVTASLGLASATPSDTVATLLRRADANAYQAKQAGGDRFVAESQGPERSAPAASG
jgi:diguanylate cyclase (GGDEF)-like protein